MNRKGPPACPGDDKASAADGALPGHASAVAIDPPENGTLFADRGYAGPGETVTLCVFPNDGYRLVSLGYLTLLAKFVKARGEGVIIH